MKGVDRVFDEMREQNVSWNTLFKVLSDNGYYAKEIGSLKEMKLSRVDEDFHSIEFKWRVDTIYEDKKWSLKASSSPMQIILISYLS